MNQVITLVVNFNIGNAASTIYPVILKDEQEMILIDCGYPNFFHLVEAAAEAKGVDLNELTKIVVTHHDFDHIGTLAEFKRKYPKVMIVTSVDDEKYVSGKAKSLRLQQAEAIYETLSEAQKREADNFHSLLESIENVNIDITVRDNDFFSWCGGTEIAATPGHMPGHISLYLREAKTLIAGDALVVENNELGIANPQYTLDLLQARESIRKLLSYDIEKIICYHGGEYTGDIKAALQKAVKL